MIELCGLLRLEAIADEWRALWRRVPAATTFQRPEWMLPWARHLAPADVRTLALRDGGRLVALAPCFVWRDAAGRRALSLIGAGLSDQMDFLAEPAHAGESARAVLAWATRSGAPWERLHLDELLPGSSLVVAAPPVSGWQDAIEPASACPELMLPRSVDRLADVVPDGFFSRLAFARRRAAREGYRLVSAAPDAVDEWLEALFRLHDARPDRARHGGFLDDPRVRAFHREAARALARAGALHLAGVRAPDGALAAVAYGFADHGRASCYLAASDPAHERVAPGDLAVLHAIEEAVRAGAFQFDFLRGAERYKYVWGARDRYNRRRRLHRVQPVLHEQPTDVQLLA